MRLGCSSSSATALVLDDSPSVLSLGRLIVDGSSFDWRAGCDPVLTNGTCERVQVGARGHAPIIAAPAVAKTTVQSGGASSSKDGGTQDAAAGAGRESVPPVAAVGAGREPVPSAPPAPPPPKGVKALDESHYLTHFPKDSRCETCSRCKMQRTPHRRRAQEDAAGEEVDAKVVGDIITADHIVLGAETDFSRHGDTAVLV